MADRIDFELPSRETLAGIYVCIEGEEDLTVRPHQIEPIEIPAQPVNGAANARNRARSSKRRPPPIKSPSARSKARPRPKR